MGRSSFAGVLFVVLAGCSAAPETEEIGASEDAIAADAKVEIKMALAEVDSGPSVLGVDPNDAELRDVTFYDTDDLALFDRGVILRTRRVIGDDDDSTVKLRPLSEKKVDERFADLDGFKCEHDKNIGKRAVSSCSLTSAQGPGEIVRASRGEQRIETLFTDDQLAFLSAHEDAPDWSSIRALGPIAAEVWKIEPDELGGEKVTVERWSVPSGGRSLEVSIKVKGKKARSAERALQTWVAARGLTASPAQETKTKAALVALTIRP